MSEQVRPRDYDGLEAQLVALDWYKFKRPRTGRQDAVPTREACRGRRCSTRTQALVARLEEFQCDADADLAARLRDELATVDRRLRSGEGARRRARLPRPAGARPRSGARQRATCARRSSAASRTCSSTSSRTPTRCRRRSSCCSRPTIPPRRDWRAVRPVPGKLFVVGDPKQSIYRFRRADVGIYEAVREQLRRARRRVRRAAQQLPRRARHPARRERRVRAADDRRRPGRPGALRAAGAGAAGPARAAGDRRAAGAEGEAVERGRRRRRRSPKGSRTRSPRSSTGWCSDERLDGDRSRAADRARAD